MTLRPDLVDVWVFRIVAGEAQILMLQRSPQKLLPGLWQGVSGGLEPDEAIRAGALRELQEETGFGEADLLGFYSLDYVTSFLWDPGDRIMTSAYFAAQVAPHAEPTLSAEHAAYRWLSGADATELSVWPAYREAIGRLLDCLLDPERAPWFRLPAGAGTVS